MKWIHEDQAYWNDDKQRIVGQAPEGVFDRRYGECRKGELMPGEWWRVEKDGKTIGFGWLDINWGDGEILLATDESERGRGVGTFILEKLAGEARSRGLNYVYNIVRPNHPDRAELTRWLQKRGFSGSEDGSLFRASSAEGN